ncbi:MAG: HEAT repeat domain-containing protein [Gammaproteobacteria bacterium]
MNYMRTNISLCALVLTAGLATNGTAATPEEDEARLVRHAVEVARELRGSDNVYDQMSGAGTLVEIGDKESLQFLADNLGHSDWVLKRSAIDTLLNVEHPAGLDVLYRYSAVVDEGVYMKFLSESLASRPREDMAEFLMESVAMDDVWVRKHALQALAVTPLDDKEIRMRAIAEDETQDAVTRAYAYYALLDTPARQHSAEKLIEISANWGPEAQEAAAVGLGRVDSDASRAALASLRDAGTYKVQIAALASQAGFGNEAATDTLVRVIATGKGLDPSVAAASLRRMPTPAVVRITNNLLECCQLNSDVGTRLLESWAGIDADPTAVLEWGLGHENPDIRMQAVWLVGARREHAYLGRIAPLLDATDTGIRAMAAWSIVRILGERYEPGRET